MVLGNKRFKSEVSKIWEVHMEFWKQIMAAVAKLLLWMVWSMTTSICTRQTSEIVHHQFQCPHIYFNPFSGYVCGINWFSKNIYRTFVKYNSIILNKYNANGSLLLCNISTSPYLFLMKIMFLKSQIKKRTYFFLLVFCKII